jgi:hypothetical protein
LPNWIIGIGQELFTDFIGEAWASHRNAGLELKGHHRCTSIQEPR